MTRRRATELKTRGVEPLDVLASLSTLTYGGLHPTPIDRSCPRFPGQSPENGGKNGNGRLLTEWVGVDELLVDPWGLATLVRAAGLRRFESDNHGLVLAQVARETISTLSTATVGLWGLQRRLLDVTAVNVVLAEGETGTVVGLRQPRLAVLATDPLAGSHPDVTVVDEAEMFHWLQQRAIGTPVPSGEVPDGPPTQVAAVGAIVASVRRVVRSGERHLWGTVALGAVSSLAYASHEIGASADRDRERLLAARPDLARTLQLVTIDDRLGDEITFAIRKTCCLLLKLPPQQQCGTCSLRDQSECLGSITSWYRDERSRIRNDNGNGN